MKIKIPISIRKEQIMEYHLIQSDIQNSNLLRLQLTSLKAAMKGQNSKKRNVSKDKQATTVGGRPREEDGKEDRKVNNYGESQREKVSSKTLKLEFDQVEDKLKDRDISKAGLEAIVTDKLLGRLASAYLQHSSLSQQVSRILVQVYSHYPIRKSLYPPPSGGPAHISCLVLPILLHNHRQLNESAAAEVIQGLVEQGGLDIIQNLKLVPFALPEQRQGESAGLLGGNVELIGHKWAANFNSIFMNMLMGLLVACLRSYYKPDTTGIDNLDSPGNHSSQPKKKGESKPKVLSAKEENPLADCSTIVKTLTILVSRQMEAPAKSPPQPCTPNKQAKALILSIISLYMENQSREIKINGGHQSQEELLLLYRWAVLSCCDTISVGLPKNKTVRCDNLWKGLFAEVMDSIRRVLQGNGHHFRQGEPAINCGKVHTILNFLQCLFYPYSLSASDGSPPLLKDEYRLVALVMHSETLLHLLTSINMEDNVKEDSIGVIVQWMFGLAVFCDEFKKKHKLEAILASIEDMGLLGDLPLHFESCESTLYRMLISIEKCLPRYSLRHYQELYIKKPGIFHLYFMDQLLALRDCSEVSKFLVQLVEKWVGVEMRDFNMLGYVCKFISHYLNDSRGNSDERLATLLAFMRQLNPEALAYLNMIFYEASFSDQPCPQYSHCQPPNPSLLPARTSMQENSNSSLTGLNKNSNMVASSVPPSLTCVLPPLTLSYFEHQSELKACGYSCSDKAIFIDRNFCKGEELFQWAPLLHEVNDDHFYYHCKYFYFLLTEAYNPNIIESRARHYQEQSKRSRRTGDRKSLTPASSESMSRKKQKIIELWQSSIHRSKVTQIQSIFQILSCWAHSVENQGGKGSASYEPILSSAQMRRMVEILLEHQEKLLNLPAIYTQNWRQAIKEMQTNSDLFENYKKEEGKIKNRQLYFLRCVTRLIENIASRLCSFVPKSLPYESVVEIVQKYSIHGGGQTCWMALRALSDKMSRNAFIEEATAVLRHGNGLAKMVRRKLELYRELIFAYIEEKVGDRGNESKNNSQSSYRNECSQNSQRSIEPLIEIELKLKISQIFQECIQVLGEPISPSKTANSLLKNEKEELYNKLLALEVVQEVYLTALTNRRSLRLVSEAMGLPSSKEKANNIRVQKSKVLEKLRSTVTGIMYRESALVTKYERRLIMYLRINCMNWVASDRSLLLGQYFGSRKEALGVCWGLLDPKELMLALWHYAMDEQVQLRLQVLSLLTNVYESDKYECLQMDCYWVSAILTLISTLEPRPRLKLYCDGVAIAKWDEILQANGSTPLNCCGYLFAILMAIGFLIFNSKTSLPCQDIFETFCHLWVRGNKDVYYLLMCALEYLQREGFRFRRLGSGEGREEDGDLKLYYMNVKARKGWIGNRQQTDSVEVEDKSSLILKRMKTSMAQKNKNAKFIKSKKEVFFDVEEFLRDGNMDVLEKMSSDYEKKAGDGTQDQGETSSFVDYLTDI